MTAVEFKGDPQALKAFLDTIVGTIVSITKAKSAGSYLVIHT